MSWVRNAARRRKQASDCYSVRLLSGTQEPKLPLQVWNCLGVRSNRDLLLLWRCYGSRLWRVRCNLLTCTVEYPNMCPALVRPELTARQSIDVGDFRSHEVHGQYMNQKVVLLDGTSTGGLNRSFSGPPVPRSVWGNDPVQPEKDTHRLRLRTEPARAACAGSS